MQGRDLVPRRFGDCDSPWLRWAAHSARISVHGMPHTFSV